MKAKVYRTGAMRFDMAGRSLGQPVQDTPEVIRKEIATAVYQYAEERVKAAGLYEMIRGWEVEVSTLDADISDEQARVYSVDWKNKHNVRIHLQGIILQKGRPVIDHGLSLSQR